jgi:hypothetical protein
MGKIEEGSAAMAFIGRGWLGFGEAPAILDVHAMLGIQGVDLAAWKPGRGCGALPSERRRRLGALAPARVGGSYIG